MPVGRIEFLNLEPMTFAEFLEASDNRTLRDYVASVDVTKNIDDVIHDKLLELLNALELLTMAKIVRPMYHSSASGLPLGACVNKDILKVTFLDVGLMQNMCGLQGKIIMEKDVMHINAGAVCEQFVGQELRAYAEPYRDNQLFFWARDKRGSQAEVDYLFVSEDRIIPVEVKAGSTGTLRSLLLFMEEKKLPIGIKLSTDTLSLHNNVLNVPLYMIDQIPRLLLDL